MIAVRIYDCVVLLIRDISGKLVPVTDDESKIALHVACSNSFETVSFWLEVGALKADDPASAALLLLHCVNAGNIQKFKLFGNSPLQRQRAGAGANRCVLQTEGHPAGPFGC
jgi:hypothetical protein